MLPGRPRKISHRKNNSSSVKDCSKDAQPSKGFVYKCIHFERWLKLFEIFQLWCHVQLWVGYAVLWVMNGSRWRSKCVVLRRQQHLSVSCHASDLSQLLRRVCQLLWTMLAINFHLQAARTSSNCNTFLARFTWFGFRSIWRFTFVPDTLASLVLLRRSYVWAGWVKNMQR